MGESAVTGQSVDGQMVWYQYPAPFVLEALDSSPAGLSDERVAQRQKRYGRNVFPGKKNVPALVIFLRQFRNPLIYVLFAASIVSVTIGDTRDAFFILVVILSNALIGTFQEWKAERGASALQKLLKTYVRIRRDGIVIRIDAEELVPGDITYLESGNRVPADIRILEARSLHADESLLTGESVVVGKTDAPLADERIPVSERSNMLFAGSTITMGRAMGVVVETGLSTELGKIALAVTGTGTVKTPLIVRMETFSGRIGYLTLASCMLLALVAFLKGMDPREVFFMAVALAVSVIPEGLPVAMTVALSVATSRMARRKVIVRKLMAVEALGSCTVIATDKTGTLTLNRQTVRLIALSGKQYRVSGEGYSGDGSISGAGHQAITPVEWERIRTMCRVAMLCNEACLYRNPDGCWQAEGDPVDIALMALGYKAGLDPASIWRSVQVLEKVPYESERMYAALIYREQGQALIAVKGAAEALLPRCGMMASREGEISFDSDAVSQELQRLTAQGYRVLVIAQGRVANTHEPTHHGLPELCFLGLVALIDPLRPEAVAAIRECHQAGIKVVMVTGDHPATALAIAHELGLTAQPEDVMTGSQLDSLEQAPRPVMIQAVQNVSVFARVAPLQKLRIVEALKEAGHYVAVTGDGVNDAPALKSAHIGVAMGTGTDVAKDAASIIITDDNFASIVNGVEEGRFAYDNIRKVVYMLVSTGAAEVCLFVLSLLANLPLPLRAVQLLWLNLVTNGIQDVALAFEKGEPGAICRKPRRPDEGIFNPLMFQESAVSGLTMGLFAFALWYGLIQNGWDEFSARNLLLLLMVLFENVHVFNCRSELQSAFHIPVQNNRLLILGVLSAQGIHILAMHWPWMREILQVEPISWQNWLWEIALASVLLFTMEVFKQYKRNRNRRNEQVKS